MYRLLLKLFLLFTPSTVFLKLQLSTLLIKVFECKIIDRRELSSLINAGHIHHFVAYYKTYIKCYFAIIYNVCYYCGFFIWISLLAIILRSNPVIIATLNNHIINLACFNHYGQKIDNIVFIFCIII